MVLLTRQGCSLCERTAARLAELADELEFDFTTTDVDAAAAAGDSALRVEFGDRLPVVLLDGTRAQLLGARRAQAAGGSREVDGVHGCRRRANLVAQLVTDYRG